MTENFPSTQTALQWRQAPFTICFTEKDQILKSTDTNTTVRYADFLALVHDLTKETAHQIPGLPIALELDEGLSLRDGPWWYRFVHNQVRTPPIQTATGWEKARMELRKGEWRVLSNLNTFRTMRRNFITERRWTGSWVEIKHQLQKNRDEGHPISESYRRPGPVVVGVTQQRRPSRASQPPPDSHHADVRHGEGPGPAIAKINDGVFPANLTANEPQQLDPALDINQKAEEMSSEEDAAAGMAKTQMKSSKKRKNKQRKVWKQKTREDKTKEKQDQDA